MDHFLANKERLEYLLTQKQSGAITLSERLELSELIRQDETSAFIADAMDEVFLSQLRYDIDNKLIDEALLSLNKKIQEESGSFVRMERPVKRYWPAIAASLILLLAAAFFINRTLRDDRESSFLMTDNVVMTKNGSKSMLILPDGTKVWLNAGSKLNYNKNYGYQTREVNLTGEAYFDVVKNKEIPFIVHTSDMKIKVLGTAFNVRAYSNEKKTEATLIRGVIEVELNAKGNKNKIILKPSDKIVVRKTLQEENNGGASKMPVVELFSSKINEKDTTTMETEWTKNRLVFEQERLESIIPTLERWYNVTIEIQKTTRPRLYSGTFENDKLEDVLESLKNVGNFNYRIESDKNKVVIF